MSIKPIFIIGEMGRGGQERQLRYLLKEIKEAGNECSLVVWEPSEKYLKDIQEIESLGVKVLRHSHSGLSQKLRKTRRFVRVERGSLLQSYSFYLNFYTAILGILCSIPVIGAVRNRLFITYESCGLLKFFLSSLLPRKKISNNRLYQKGIRFPFLNVIYRHTMIVPNQLNMAGKVFHSRPLSDHLISCSIGRLYPEKDLFLLIDAIAAIRSKGLQIEHRHAGTGPLLGELKKHAQERGVADCFTFVGELQNIDEFLTNSSMFLHSSRAEGYPNVIMEAMANGRPILTTRCGDVEDLVLEGFNGYTVPIGDLNGFTQRLRYLIEHRDKLNQLGENSFTLAKQKFDMKNLMLDTYKAYTEFNLA